MGFWEAFFGMFHFAIEAGGVIGLLFALGAILIVIGVVLDYATKQLNPTVFGLFGLITLTGIVFIVLAIGLIFVKLATERSH